MNSIMGPNPPPITGSLKDGQHGGLKDYPLLAVTLPINFSRGKSSSTADADETMRGHVIEMLTNFSDVRE